MEFRFEDYNIRVRVIFAGARFTMAVCGCGAVGR